MKSIKDFRLIFMFSAVFLFSIRCDRKESITALYETDFKISIAKWYQNHAAAITFDYDTGSPYIDRERKVTDKVLEYGLRMDFEIVAKNFENRPQMRDYFINYLIPNGFGYYGHGYEHINHDALTYDLAYVSFKLTYDIIKKYGLKPISFAYPKSFGYEEKTQFGLKMQAF